MSGPASAAALRDLHVPGAPLVLPNAWDAGSARLVAEAGFAAIATTSSGVAEALGHRDGEDAPVDEVLRVVSRIARAVALPLTADMEGGYGLPGGELAARVVAAGAVGLNVEDTDHPRRPALKDPAAHAAYLAAVKAGGELVVNARIDVHLRRAGTTADALERARRYLDAGADCLYPIGIADERDIAAFVALGAPVNVLLRPGTPSPQRLAELGVARVSLGEGLHAVAVDAVRRRLAELAEPADRIVSPRGTRS
jgi:2-methylisocitrate lyase-like PEP mutase family enzyme